MINIRDFADPQYADAPEDQEITEQQLNDLEYMRECEIEKENEKY